MNHLSKPVTLKMKITPAVVKPAETVSSIENFLDIATAAIAYVTNVSSRDSNQGSPWSSTYLHRLDWKRYTKGNPSQYVPET